MSDFDVIDDSSDEIKKAVKTGKMDRGLARELKREASYYTKMIPRVLAEMGYDHWLRKESRPDPFEKILFGKSSRQMVKIIHAAYNEACIYLRIDPLRLPYRVTIPLLQEEEVLETLSVACGRKVTFALRDYANGAWFCIHRSGVISSIPKEFGFRDAINSIAQSAPPLKYCAGLGENLKLVQPNIAEMPHLLVAGASGMGKSVHLNSILCQIMWRNGPDKLKFLLIDLKGGMELQDYENVPHLWRPIVTKIEDVVDALQMYRDEMDRRQKIMAGKAKTLDQWNRVHKDKMPYIILVIDELALLLKNPESDISHQAKLILGAILAISRSTGGHCILCTQRPSVDIVDGYLKANVPARIAFGLPTQADSRVVLDTSQAAEIDIKGRAWMLTEANRVQLQSPWISPTLIRKTIKAIIERQSHPDRLDVDVNMIIETSLSKFDGKFTEKLLWDEFKGRIPRDSLREIISQLDGEVIEHDGVCYQIVEPSGVIPRHLEKIEFELPIAVNLPDSVTV